MNQREREREKKAGAGNLYPEINFRECGIGFVCTVGDLWMEKEYDISRLMLELATLEVHTRQNVLWFKF